MSLKEVLYGCSLSKVLYLAEITVYNIWDHLLYVLIDFYVYNVGVHVKLITLYTVQLGYNKSATVYIDLHIRRERIAARNYRFNQEMVYWCTSLGRAKALQ